MTVTFPRLLGPWDTKQPGTRSEMPEMKPLRSRTPMGLVVSMARTVFIALLGVQVIGRAVPRGSVTGPVTTPPHIGSGRAGPHRSWPFSP
ncbi:hypothetical protein GCM10009528_24680 [Kineococcus aurantiacus]